MGSLKEKGRGRVTQNRQSGGIKIYLQVTMAAMIAARNFPLKMNVTCPLSHPLPSQPRQALSVLINSSLPF